MGRPRANGISAPLTTHRGRGGTDVSGASVTEISGVLRNAGPGKGPLLSSGQNRTWGLLVMGKRPGEQESPGGELRFLTWAPEAPRGREHWKAWDCLAGGTPCEVGEREVGRNVRALGDPARS